MASAGSAVRARSADRDLPRPVRISATLLPLQAGRHGLRAGQRTARAVSARRSTTGATAFWSPISSTHCSWRRWPTATWSAIRSMPRRNPVINISSYGHPARVFPTSKPDPWRLARSKDPAWVKFYGAAEATANGYFTAASGQAIYRGGQFPAEYYGNHFSVDNAQNMVHRCLLVPEGAGYTARRPRGRREDRVPHLDRAVVPPGQPGDGPRRSVSTSSTCTAISSKTTRPSRDTCNSFTSTRSSPAPTGAVSGVSSTIWPDNRLPRI